MTWACSVLNNETRWAVTQGDCLAVLAELPADSVDLIFGSPPYVDARLYLEDGADLGIARGAEEWAAWMCEVYRECLRVCRGLVAMVVEGRTRNYSYDAAPARLMADLVRSGVCLRKPPIYRRVGIPGSGGPDWLRNDWEWIICATRGGKLPWSDNTACGHPPKWAPGGECSNRKTDGSRSNNPWNGSSYMRFTHRRKDGTKRDETIRKPHGHGGTPRKPDGSREVQPYEPPVLANPGNVIECLVGGGNLGNDIAHENEAPYPERLCEFFIRSFAPPGGIVFDPFCGSGTSLAVSIQWGRRALGCDLRQSQVELTKRRCRGAQPPLFVEG